MEIIKYINVVTITKNTKEGVARYLIHKQCELDFLFLTDCKRTTRSIFEGTGKMERQRNRLRKLVCVFWVRQPLGDRSGLESHCFTTRRHGFIASTVCIYHKKRQKDCKYG